MHQRRRLTFCIVNTAASPDEVMRAVQSVFDHAPSGEFELRLGCGTEPFYRVVGASCPDGIVPERYRLPLDLERFRWTARDNLPITAWVSGKRTSCDVLTRHIFHDVPLRSQSVVRLSEGSLLEPTWWESIRPILDNGVDYIGQPSWYDYSPAQADVIQTFPWYLGVPFDRREGRVGVSYMSGPFTVVRTDSLRQANFPNAIPSGHIEQTQVIPSDVLLGEIARQLAWKQEAYRGPITPSP